MVTELIMVLPVMVKVFRCIGSDRHQVRARRFRNYKIVFALLIDVLVRCLLNFRLIGVLFFFIGRLVLLFIF